jgi:hypothetical protein
MTPEQRAREVIDEIIACYVMPEGDWCKWIENAIRAALAAEREACAKIAEAEGCSDPQCLSCVGNVIAQAIRTGRSEGTP